MKSFNEILLPQALERALKAMNFDTPTPIQAAAIPLALKGGDLIGCAQTGTGKTAAFSIPVIAKILATPESRALILTPTRELATQIEEVVLKLTNFSRHIRSALLIGGVPMGRQFQALSKTPSIIIATPGRLSDHFRRGNVDLGSVNTVVLDEADRMLDMGFAPQINEILEFVPEERQTLLFSATLPQDILKMSEKYMRSPERVNVGGADRPAPKIKASHVELPGVEKNDRILQELQSRTGATILVFARTQQRTDRLSKFLKNSGVKAAAIHGGRTQSQRNEALSGFRNGRYPVLVATDVASRGLDIPQITLVVNYDLPQTAEDYIHRIGRTGRAGEEGEAISFVTPEERSHWKALTRTGEDSKGRSNFKKAAGNFRRGFRGRFQGFRKSSSKKFSSPAQKFRQA